MLCSLMCRHYLSHDHTLPASFAEGVATFLVGPAMVVPGVKVSGRATALVSVTVSRFFFAVRMDNC